MSGGHFDYAQYRIQSIIDSIEQAIINNEKEYRGNEWFKAEKFENETIDEFKVGLIYLKMAQIYAHRIDWLLSGDDNEESFHKRLSEDLEEPTKNKEK